MNAMGVAVGDYMNELKIDLAVSNMGPIRLFHQTAAESWSDEARSAGVTREFQSLPGQVPIAWGLAFADFSLKGREDLFVASGALDYSELAQPSQLYFNLGKNRFADISAVSHVDTRGFGRGVAIADYDRSGLPSILLISEDGKPRLFHNITHASGRNWLEVHLVGTRSNRDGCGAVVVAQANGLKWMRNVVCGSGLASDSDRTVHFGLGTQSSVTLKINWPTGIVQTVQVPAVNTILRIVEP
jgi:hypothetical protein